MSRSSVTGFRPDIQGLRALAVLLVVLYHAQLPYLTGGFIGVDVFFVISGFLITTHILQSLQESRFTFADFYARRVRRILPASLFVVIATLAIAWIVIPPLAQARVARDAAWTALYIPNILFAREGIDYLASPQPSLFQHYWSLGIEEQFYLLWPLLLWGIYRLARRRISVTAGAIALIVTASFVGSVVLTPQNQPWAFFLLPTRAWELGVGGLVAFVLLRRPPALGKWTRAIIGAISFAVLVGTAFVFTDSTLFPSYSAALPVLATAVLIFAGPYEGVFAAVLQNRTAQWIGAISYSVYLVHWPLLVLPVAASSWALQLELWQSLLLALLSIPIGWLCYRFIETPFRRPRKRTRGRAETWIPLVSAVVLAAVVAGISVAGMRSIASEQMTSETAAPIFKLSTDPIAPPVVGSNLNVRLQDSPREYAIPSGPGCNLTVLNPSPPPACTYGPDPDAMSVALVGDSHAAQWAPALERVAETGEIYLTAHTKSGCSIHERNVRNEGTTASDCVDWRKAVIDLLKADPPKVIIIASSMGSFDTSASDYEIAMSRMLPLLPKESTVVLLQDTPRFPGDPISCLSSNLNSPEKCSIPIEKGVNPEHVAANINLAKNHGAVTLNLNDYLCAKTCPVVQGNMLVFKDSHHISRQFSREASPVFARFLDSLRKAEPGN